MRTPPTERLTDLLTPRRPPCISLYLPTSRSYPARQQDPVRYRNQLDAAEEMLRRQYPGHEVRALMDRFRALTDDQFFWNHRLDGLAAFGCSEFFDVFDLQRQPREQVVVADSFHLKPLLRYTQSADRYQVLCLQREKVKLLEGDRYALDELDPAGVPTTVREMR